MNRLGTECPPFGCKIFYLTTNIFPIIITSTFRKGGIRAAYSPSCHRRHSAIGRVRSLMYCKGTPLLVLLMLLLVPELSVPVSRLR
jgi:hypothetical protein